MMQTNTNETAWDEQEDRLVKWINSLPGNKTVTLACLGSVVPCIAIDVQGSNWCKDRFHMALFWCKFAHAMMAGGGLTVRHFTSRDPVGGLPQKDLYGFALGEGRITASSAEQMRLAHCTDFETGKPLQPEPACSWREAKW